VNASGEGLRIGALMTLAELAANAEVKRQYPELAAALGEAASPQIRNLATLGGNLCQRPRCWYFRSGHGLLAKGPDGKSLVPTGENRYHAILGNEGPAYFVSPSTIAPVLIAYQAKVRLLGPQGARELPLDKFFVVPQGDQEREHDLKPNEIVTDILIPPAANVHAGHYEVRQKEAFDWPYATAAVVLTMGGKTVQNARVVLGHVAPVPWLSAEAAQALAGKTITPEKRRPRRLGAVARPGAWTQRSKNPARAVAVKRAILKAEV